MAWQACWQASCIEGRLFLVREPVKRVASQLVALTTAISVVLTSAALTPIDANAAVLAACPNVVCQHLPFVSRTKPVAIVEAHSISLRGGSYGVVGTVRNFNGDAPVYDVVIEASFYEGGGGRLDTNTTRTVLTATLPSQSNPFTILSTAQIGLVYRYTVNIQSYSLTNTQTIVTQTLSFAPKLNSSGSIGTVENPTPFNVRDVRVTLWTPLFSSSCNSVVEIYDLPGVLMPGHTITFTPYGCGFGQPFTGLPNTTLTAAQAVVVP